MKTDTLTAAVEGSAEVERRAQTEGVRYCYDTGEGTISDGELWIAHDRGMALRHLVHELIDQANALPAVQAQLEAERQLKAEAVELLRRLTSTSPLMQHGAGIDARAFLAKVDAL